MLKTYKISLLSKICWAIFILLIFVGGAIIMFVSDKESLSLSQIIIFLGGIIFFGGGLYGASKIRITIDETKIEFSAANIMSIFAGKGIQNTKITLDWNEIGELDSRYVLYPESPIIILKPKIGHKNKIEFMMFGMPIELLMDILSHLPKEAKINLYTYLKRKLEGKQTLFFPKQEWHDIDVEHIRIKPHIYTKLQMFIIAALLSFIVIAGFLISWFFWK